MNLVIEAEIFWFVGEYATKCAIDDYTLLNSDFSDALPGISQARGGFLK